jgi:hypothetical protein
MAQAVSRMVLVLCTMAVLCAVVMSVPSVHAQSTAQSMFATDVPVADRSTKAWRAAVVTAYQHVLIRVSGNAHVNQLQSVQATNAKAVRFVTQYAYLKSDNAALPLHLQVVFNQQAVRAVLQAAGQPVWSGKPAQFLFWMAVRQNHRQQAQPTAHLPSQPSAATEQAAVPATASSTTVRPHVVTDSEDPRISHAIQQAAKIRGLNAQLPMMDLTDQQQLSALDLWQLRQHKVWQASKRYGRMDVLMGKVFRDDDDEVQSWQGIWFWQPAGRQKSRTVSFQTYGDSPQQTYTRALDWLADRMANEREVRNAQPVETTTLVVRGIRDWGNLQKMLTDLQQFDGVRKVRLTSMQSSQVTLAVEANGGMEGLKQILSHRKMWQSQQLPASAQTDSAISPRDATSDDDDEDNVAQEEGQPAMEQLIYHWSPGAKRD